MQSPTNKKIGIPQSESKLALAIAAHLRQILRTVFGPDGRCLSPVAMDQAELLLCAASLRALLFDDSPAPILLKFLKQHDIPIKIEAIETDLAMIFLAQVEPPEQGHISDFLIQILLNPTTRQAYELDKPTPLLISGDACKSYKSMEAQPQVWRTPEEAASANIFQVGYSNLGGPSQLCHFTRRRVSLDQWGNVRLGFLREIPIRRSSIICYVANKLGGVHYDSTRLPRDRENREEFKMLAQAYDWENQAIMHAGLVAVAIACIEIAVHPQIRGVFRALQRFNDVRLGRLLQNEPSNWGSVDNSHLP